MRKLSMPLYVVLALILLSTLVSSFNHTYWDVTLNKDHGLNAATITLLQSTPTPIDIELVSDNESLKRQVSFFVDRLKPYHTINFKVRSEVLNPQQQNDGFSTDGVIIKANGNTQTINLAVNHLNELSFSNALFKLKRSNETWIAFMTGHGEPGFDNKTNSYSMLETALKQQNFKVQALNLAKVGFIPDNTSLLVITNPKSDYLPKEIELIQQYIQKGGALLWLMDFQGKPLNFLTQLFGVYPHEGVIVDKHGQDLGTPHPAISLVTEYDDMRLFSNQDLTAFPWAQALLSFAKAPFEKTKLFQTHEESWTQTGPLEGQLKFEPEKGQISGPLTLAYLLERPLAQGTQTVIIIGNHRFATNAAIQNYGNLSLIMRFVNHLVDEPTLTNIDYGTPQDLMTVIPRSYIYFLNFGMMLIYPCLILLVGWGITRKVRSA